MCVAEIDHGIYFMAIKSSCFAELFERITVSFVMPIAKFLGEYPKQFEPSEDVLVRGLLNSSFWEIAIVP